MRNKYGKIQTILYVVGLVLLFHVFLYAIPIITGIAYQEYHTNSLNEAFLYPLLISLGLGGILVKTFKIKRIDTTTSMIICSVSWIIISLIGAIPFMIGIKASFINAFFEAVSGYTTTGITMFQGLNDMPKSILIWRATIQWAGGLGILSFFLAITYVGSSAHFLFGAESHKISSKRPRPNLFSTVKILWGIYLILTFTLIFLFKIEGMSIYDSIAHAFTTVSTGGYSPYDESIAYYSLHSNIFPYYKIIEYTVIIGMLAGGTNFLILYNLMKGKIKSLWDNYEMKLWWILIFGSSFLIMLDILNNQINHESLEQLFRHTLFQVSAIITTTGFATKDINIYPYFSKLIFLILMFIGGCVGSTGGGFKVLRIGILFKLGNLEIKKIMYPHYSIITLVIDKENIPIEETYRLVSLLVFWVGILFFGAAIGNFFGHLSLVEAFSGMASALGNVGPCYISMDKLIHLPAIIKIIYIFGMLAGRLEIFPLIILLSAKAWYR